jgi:hypothetical protein
MSATDDVCGCGHESCRRCFPRLVGIDCQMPKRPSLTIRQKAERLRLLACLPDSPVYGSDLVPLIDDVTTALLGLLPPEAQP